jgi:hypothetical protein
MLFVALGAGAPKAAAIDAETACPPGRDKPNHAVSYYSYQPARDGIRPSAPHTVNATCPIHIGI